MSLGKNISDNSYETKVLKVKQILVNNEFCKENGIADLTLIVEYHKIPVSKAVLCIASPVFRTMVEGHFREKTESEIPLPGKRYENFVEFLRCIYPDMMQTVTERNVYMLLPLAHEYDVRNMMKSCKIILMQIVGNMHIRNVEEFYRHIHLSEMYNMKELKDRCIYLASENTLKQFKEAKKIYKISDASHYKIIELALRRHELNEADEKDFTVNTQIKNFRPVRVPKRYSTELVLNDEVTFQLQGKFLTNFQDEKTCLKSLRVAERFGLEMDNKNISSILHQNVRVKFEQFNCSEEFDLLPEKIKSALQTKN